MTRTTSLAVSCRQHFLAWTFCTLYIPWVMAITLVTFGKFNDTLGRAMIRFWGKTMLRCANIRLEVTGLEEFNRRERRVVTFNHGSTLDIFIITALLPPGGVGVVKRELVFIPFIGWGVALLDFIRLDRRNREKAIASLEFAGKRMRDEELSVMIAPEGTRSRDSDLGPFKLGAFHLARHSRAPIVPMVIDGARRQWPMGQFNATPGVVKVRFLPAISTDDYTVENAREKADELRAVYFEAMGLSGPEESLRDAS